MECFLQFLLYRLYIIRIATVPVPSCYCPFNCSHVYVMWLSYFFRFLIVSVILLEIVTYNILPNCDVPIVWIYPVMKQLFMEYNKFNYWNRLQSLLLKNALLIKSSQGSQNITYLCQLLIIITVISRRRAFYVHVLEEFRK